MQIVCEICGKTFETAASNAKYCSRCKPIASKITRAKWEQKTNYRHKKNKKQNEHRAAMRSEHKSANAFRYEERVKERERKLAESADHRLKELTEKAAAGDLFASMQLSMINGDVYNYWKYYALCIQAEDERLGSSSRCFVNGVHASECDFAEKLLYQRFNEKEEKH